MKIFLQKILVALGMLHLTFSCNAQIVFEKYSSGGNSYGRVNDPGGTPALGVGIGNFTGVPAAALHINTNLFGSTCCSKSYRSVTSNFK